MQEEEARAIERRLALGMATVAVEGELNKESQQVASESLGSGNARGSVVLCVDLCSQNVVCREDSLSVSLWPSSDLISTTCSEVFLAILYSLLYAA